MLQRIKRIASINRQEQKAIARWPLEAAQLVWAVGSLCALNRVPFDAELLLKQFPPPYTTDTLIHAARALGFRIQLKPRAASALDEVATPCLAVLAPLKNEAAAEVEVPAVGERAANRESPIAGARLGLITDVSPERVQYFEAGTKAASELPRDEFAERYLGVVFFIAKRRPPIFDPDVVGSTTHFGFRWFVPDLLKHKKVWRDVLLASLVMQLLALGTPLFTQTIIDKVVVHRTQSTLLVIAIGMAVFMIFSAILTWVRQYLVLHTGNRVDAVLAAAVFDHLFKLPPRYFEKRPTAYFAERDRSFRVIVTGGEMLHG